MISATMDSMWNDHEAAECKGDLVALRVYTSRLLGRDPSLVMHGGGNTSVKVRERTFLGEEEDLLYVKGSGWDLATIAREGFAPVRLATLRKMAGMEALSDLDMVREQRAAMTIPTAPTPSVEAILHAIVPLRFVDHTHADAVVTLTNTKQGKSIVKEIYGDRVLLVPYVMPGFVLAREVFRVTRDVDWSRLDAMILFNHGVFTFADDARESYEKMISVVSEAETYLASKGAYRGVASAPPLSTDREHLHMLASIRKEVANLARKPMLACWNRAGEALGFSQRDDASDIATRGPITPDHVLHTKNVPAVLRERPLEDLSAYAAEYRKYFDRNTDGSLRCLDPAPRWVVWLNRGTISFGHTLKQAKAVQDIAEHTVRAIQWGESLGGWRPLPEKPLFDVEYWELEQAKLERQATAQPPFQGKVALVTGAASGIGRACTEVLREDGAVVVALDIDPKVKEISSGTCLGICCDVTQQAAVRDAVSETVSRFGGLDILLSNAGTFPPGKPIEEIEEAEWERSLAVNLSSHQKILRAVIPFLKLGLDPAVVIIASKNVPAPGPGASAYSAAKAGLTQLARIAALELAKDAIRVNILHPDAVFDTAIWTVDLLENRAKHYGMTVEEYKRKNLLGVEISSRDVAMLACVLAGPVFSKTTGAQISIDGGNDRVI